MNNNTDIATDYFPHDDYFDIYCPHLLKGLGPCEECDNIAYLKYLAEVQVEVIESYSNDGYDSRHLDIREEDFAHIPLA